MNDNNRRNPESGQRCRQWIVDFVALIPGGSMFETKTGLLTALVNALSMKGLRLAFVVFCISTASSSFLAQNKFDPASPLGAEFDGKRIVFTSTREKVRQIWYVDITRLANGEHAVPKLLTKSKEALKGENWFPSFSPDGKSIVYVSNRVDKQNNDIYLMELKISNNGDEVSVVSDRRLTESPENEENPSFSPDGKRVVYQKHNKNTHLYEVWTMDIYGANALAFTVGKDDYTSPVWEKNFIDDGQTIAYQIQSLESIQLKPFPSTSGTDPGITSWKGSGPSWSPDAGRIAYGKQVSGRWNIYTSNIEGKLEIQVTSGDAEQVDPCWSKNGQWLAFVSSAGNLSGIHDLYVVSLRYPGNMPYPITTPIVKEIWRVEAPSGNNGNNTNPTCG